MNKIGFRRIFKFLNVVYIQSCPIFQYIYMDFEVQLILNSDEFYICPFYFNF